MPLGWKIALGCMLAIIALLGLGMIGAANRKPRSDEIMENCQREFGDEGQQKVNACAIAVMTQELDQRERDKLERAMR